MPKALEEIAEAVGPNDLFEYCDRDAYACDDDGKLRQYFDCSCGSTNHLFKFSLEPSTGDFALSSFLNDEHRGFFGRLWAGLAYAFGHRCAKGHWDRVVLDRSAVERLHLLTNEALGTMQEVNVPRHHN